MTPAETNHRAAVTEIAWRLTDAAMAAGGHLADEDVLAIVRGELPEAGDGEIATVLAGVANRLRTRIVANFAEAAVLEKEAA